MILEIAQAVSAATPVTASAKAAAATPAVNYFLQAMTYAGAFSAIGFSAIGSSLGSGAASAAAIGAWKKCYAQNKPAPFQLLIFAGAALSQTIYGMIIMFIIMGKAPATYAAWPLYLAVGVLSGIAMGISAWKQGVAAAAACDSFAENGKGFTNQMMTLGIIETIAIFIMAFSIVLLSGIN